MPDEASEQSKARRSKIGAMPVRIREELNQRLLDGQGGPQIIPWLHSLPEVLTVLDQRFHEEPVSPQNLSEWRKSGYAEWLARREKADHIKTLSDYALKLAQAGGANLEAGAAAIAGGKILELLEASTAEDASETAVGLPLLIECLTSLRKEATKAQKVDLDRVKLAQNERELVLMEERFRRITCSKFLDWFEDEKARRVVEGGGNREEKLQKLVQMMFGERPEIGKREVV